MLGFEDPDLSSIPNGAPTLGKDARQLMVQKVVSNRWRLINFDVATAFLQGKGDGRRLGITPPYELRKALKMGPHDQCLLEGGAYGRIDAPFLWFQTFKETLEKLGFLQSPFDACTCSLVTQDAKGNPVVHGVLGIHVDDGIGGGDPYFTEVVQKLRATVSGRTTRLSLPSPGFISGNGTTGVWNKTRFLTLKGFNLSTFLGSGVNRRMQC